MRVRTEIIFKRGIEVIAIVTGDKDAETITVTDVAHNVIETEQFLERLTGLRVHINVAFLKEPGDAV